MLTHTHSGWILLLARVFLGLIFILGGLNKLMGFSGTVQFIDGAGLPMPAVAAAIAVLVELGGGILLVIGWQTRWAALAIAIFTLAAAALFHFDFANQMQQTQFMKNLAIVGGMLYVFIFGAGRISIDGRKRTHRHEEPAQPSAM